MLITLWSLVNRLENKHCFTASHSAFCPLTSCLHLRCSPEGGGIPCALFQSPASCEISFCPANVPCIPRHGEAASTAASAGVVCPALQALRGILVCLATNSQAPKDPLAVLRGRAAAAEVNDTRAEEQAVLPAGELIQQTTRGYCRC